MDIINHIVIGYAISIYTTLPWWYAIIISILADIPVLVGGIVLGYYFRRPYYIAKDVDRSEGYRLFPGIKKFYEYTHSLVSIGVYITIAYYADFSIIATVICGLAHIVFDIITHTGQRSIKPFYPFANWKISGYIDVWNLPWNLGILINCVICFLVAIVIYLLPISPK